MRRLLPLLLFLSCPAGHALDFDHALDTRVQSILRLGFDSPELASHRLEKLEREPGNSAHADQLLFARARLLTIGGDTVAALALADRIAASPGQESRVELLRAEIAERNGQTAQAEQAALRSQEGFARACGVVGAGDPPERLLVECDFRSLWVVLNILERVYLNSGVLPLAETAARQSLGLALSGKDPYLAAISQGWLAVISQQQGQNEAAKRWIEEALHTSQGDTMALARVKGYEAIIEAGIHDSGGEFRAFEEALELATKADAYHYIAQLQANLTDAYLKEGKPAEALRLAHQALPALARFNDRRIERVLRHNMAVAHLRLHQFERARAELARVEDLRRGLSDNTVQIRELAELSEAWAQAGEPREAIRVFREERRLTDQVQALNRAVALQQMRTKFDSERKQRDLELLKRDADIKDQELANQSLARKVGIAAASLLSLSLVLVVIMLLRVRDANRRLKSRQVLLRIQSERDPLTDLANRRYFLALMEDHARETFHGSLLMVDIDHFKHVNDEHGHAAGDEVIAEVARRLGRAVRTEDLVVRWGGEEYLVFVPGMPQSQLQPLVERILAEIGGEPVQTESGPLRVTVSIGFANFPLPPAGLELHWERAVNWADMAMYTAKATGRNRAVGVVSVQAGDAGAVTDMEADFEAAWKDERITLITLVGPQS